MYVNLLPADVKMVNWYESPLLYRPESAAMDNWIVPGVFAGRVLVSVKPVG